MTSFNILSQLGSACRACSRAIDALRRRAPCAPTLHPYSQVPTAICFSTAGSGSFLQLKAEKNLLEEKMAAERGLSKGLLSRLKEEEERNEELKTSLARSEEERSNAIVQAALRLYPGYVVYLFALYSHASSPKQGSTFIIRFAVKSIKGPELGACPLVMQDEDGCAGGDGLRGREIAGRCGMCTCYVWLVHITVPRQHVVV